MRTVKKMATTLARGFDSEQAPSARSSQLVSRLLDVAWCFGGRKVSQLGGGFKYFGIFTPILGEMMKFDIGWKQTTN